MRRAPVVRLNHFFSRKDSSNVIVRSRGTWLTVDGIDVQGEILSDLNGEGRHGHVLYQKLSRSIACVFWHHKNAWPDEKLKQSGERKPDGLY